MSVEEQPSGSQQGHPMDLDKEVYYHKGLLGSGCYSSCCVSIATWEWAEPEQNRGPMHKGQNDDSDDRPKEARARQKCCKRKYLYACITDSILKLVHLFKNKSSSQSQQRWLVNNYLVMT